MAEFVHTNPFGISTTTTGERAWAAATAAAEAADADAAAASSDGAESVVELLRFTDGESRTVVDAAWMSEKLKKPVSSATVLEQSKQGGLSGEFCFVECVMASSETTAEGEKLSLAVKSSPGTYHMQVPHEYRCCTSVYIYIYRSYSHCMMLFPHAVSHERLSKSNRAALGTAREAFFYNEFAAQLKALECVPRCYYAKGNMKTGETIAFLQNFADAVPAGAFFGPGNPNNWACKDQLAEMSEGNPSCVEITERAFRLYARLHGSFWMEPSLLEKPWLRATEWYRGAGKASWQHAQNMAIVGWATMTAERQSGTSEINWDDHLVACLDASFAKVDWIDYVSRSRGTPYSLVHGDAHPHNALWVNQRTEEAKLVLIDFEMVGVGSPAQELGQYMISHMEPDTRRACEKQVVQAYHEELLRMIRPTASAQDEDGESDTKEAYTFEACWAEYIAGGIGRWAWFIPLFRGQPKMGQYFHDQLAAFLKDHIQDPKDMPQPRV